MPQRRVVINTRPRLTTNVLNGPTFIHTDGAQQEAAEGGGTPLVGVAVGQTKSLLQHPQVGASGEHMNSC